MEREKHEFDVLVIYIPNRLSKMRELKNENVYFDLHDSLKYIVQERYCYTDNRRKISPY